MATYSILEFLLPDGSCPFNTWLTGLKDVRGRAQIRTRLDRVCLGNLGDHAFVGDGVFELRLFHGPGYRVYYGNIGSTGLLLLGGGSKRTQLRDIRIAKEYWADYKRRK